MRLIWQSKIEPGLTASPVALLKPVGESPLGYFFGAPKRDPEGSIVGQWNEVAELRQVGHPAITNGLGNEVRERGVAQGAASGAG